MARVVNDFRPELMINEDNVSDQELNRDLIEDPYSAKKEASSLLP